MGPPTSIFQFVRCFGLPFDSVAAKLGKGAARGTGQWAKASKNQVPISWDGVGEGYPPNTVKSLNCKHGA